MKRFGVLAWPAAIGIALAIGVGTAIGAGRGVPITIHDPQGDADSGHVDIATIGMATGSGRITWTIGTYTSFTKYTAPCVFVKSVNPAGARWSICRLSSGAAPPCYTSISTSAPYPRGGGCSGPAVIRLVGTKTVTYTVPLSMCTKFKPAPHTIEWRAEIRALKDCYPTPCDQTAFGRTRL